MEHVTSALYLTAAAASTSEKTERADRANGEGDVNGRIEAIETLIAEKGEDVFLVYSLGMEMLSAERFDEAAAKFARCIELDAGYLPAYTEAGKAYRSAGRLEQAREMFAAGMELAAQQGETHMRDHLQQQLDGLPRP